MQEIQQLLAITKQLRDNPNHQGRKFSLDGKLVGDIGEVLAATKYGLELLDENAFRHDAKEIATGRMVQIKASFNNNSYFPFGENKLPDYFLSINILENGDAVVLTQALNVKGTNFTASKGTVVKKIKLVSDNAEQIEGKINEQTIVILCKFVKKN